MPMSNKSHTKIYLRADGSSSMGLGHVYRLLAVAEMLSEQYTCMFIVKTDHPALINTIGLYCDEVYVLGNDTHEPASLAELPQGIFVLDGYAFNASYQKTLREAGHKVVRIDDLATDAQVADVVLNHAGHFPASLYRSALYTRLCLGPAYALIRNAFRQAIQQERTIASLEKVFICLGGADPNNLSRKVLEYCIQKGYAQIHLVLGGAYMHRDTLETLLASSGTESEVVLQQNLSAGELIDFMQRCDLAILSSSSISYEAAMVGIGMITLAYVDNQAYFHRFFKEEALSIALNLLEGDSLESLPVILDQVTPTSIQEQIQRQRRVFSDSGEAILRLFSKLELERDCILRRAVLEDVILYFTWANDPDTRANSIHTQAISWDTHVAWFEGKLESVSSFLYVCEYSGRPVGQLRFEAKEDKYLVNFTIAPEWRGKGFGDILLKLSLEQLEKDLGFRPSVSAWVKEGNESSQRIFQNLAFVQTDTTEYQGCRYLVFEKT